MILNRRRFLSWAAAFEPRLAPIIAKSDAAPALGDATPPDTPAGSGNAVLDALGRAAQLYVNEQNRRDLFNANLERAKQGLPPLDANGQPVSASAAVSPQAIEWLKFAGLLLGGYWLVSTLAPRRR